MCFSFLVVAQAEDTSKVDAQAVEDPPSGRFTWTIENFSRLPKKLYSNIFKIGGHNWYVCPFLAL